MLNIVLYQPEIPANTGTIGRSCVLTDTRLHLIEPCGFDLSDRMIRRAGMGYWHELDVTMWDSFEQLVASDPSARFWFCSKKAAHSYHEVEYADGDYLVFGRESSGLPEDLLEANLDHTLRIPMLVRASINPATKGTGPTGDPDDPDAVSLNLSNAANIVLYEALRQLDFPGLVDEGILSKSR